MTTKEKEMNAPYLRDNDGDFWVYEDKGMYRLARGSRRNTLEQIEEHFGPVELLRTGHNSNGLPDLSQWYEVPRGATIPAGTRYLEWWDENDFNTLRFTQDFTRDSELPRCFTPEPLADPDANLVDSIITAKSPEVARALIDLIRGTH